MKSVSRALVALDFSEMDDHLISYSHLFSDALGLNRVYFTHVIPDYLFAQKKELTLHGTVTIDMPLDERVKTAIQKKVTKVYNQSEGEPQQNVDILEGRPYETILHWLDVKEIDLLITGRKKKSEGSGITARNIARHADCNVLFVPEGANPAPQRILVPVDFSKHSERALKAAIEFKKIVPEIEIVGLNVVRYMPADYYFGLDMNTEYKEALFEQTEKEYHAFMRQFQIPEEGIEMMFIENSYNNTARHINKYANDNDFDLIIMGAQGHGIVKRLVYGSITERLMDLCDELPVMIVR